MRWARIRRRVIGVAGAVTWMFFWFWTWGHNFHGFGIESLLADMITLIVVAMMGLSVWEHYHPRPKRRRSREREAAEQARAT
jgi:hypothetical protein